MTKKETVSYLEDLDDYFRIHSWCTQMDDKITAFMKQLDHKSRSYVKEWAFNNLEKKNLESASQILSIIFLKLLDVSDRELIRLLYTVLSDRLTYEDFNSLNAYIFKGKPPLSRDLFYNITERVFIDKKSALKKALSISSIISEADPELTIFYMTMLLCRVDLNNENKAMLNLLLYCVDADIPVEMSEGIRGYLSSITDVLEEILNKSEDKENRTVLEQVYHHLREETKTPGIITIEQKADSPGQAVRVNPAYDNEEESADVQASPVDDREGLKTPSIKTKEDIPDQKSSRTFSNTSENIYGISVKSEEKNPDTSGSLTGIEKPGSVPVSEQHRDFRSLEEAAENQNRTVVSDQDDTSDKEIREKIGAVSAERIKPLSGLEVFSKKGADVSDRESEGKQSTPAEETPKVKQYRISLRSFKLSDLASIIRRKRNKKDIPGSGVKNTHRTEEKNIPGAEAVESVSSSGGSRGYRLGKKTAIIAAVAVLTVFSGWYFLKKGKTNLPPEIVSGGLISKTAESAVSTPSDAVSSAKKTDTVQSDGPPAEGKQWYLTETADGIEWTVQKGESVWLLYEYLRSNTPELSGKLKALGERDWLPFIHQVINLNPWKSFAGPIEPGEKFLISR